MTPTFALLASILLQSPPEPPPPLDVDACLKAPPACVKVAGAHFEAGRFTEAIVLFEALAYANPQKPKYHYFAGLAWEGAGDDTAAYIHLRQFLISSKLNPDDRARAEQRVRTIATRTTRLLVQLPARDELRTLRLKRTNPSRSGEPTLSAPIIALPLVDDRREILVNAGAWELSVDPAALGDIEIPPLPLIIEPGPQRRLVELAVRTIRHELTVDLGPTKALSRGINIHLVQPGTPPVDVTAKSPTVRRELPSGHWQYEARARGFRPSSGILNLKGPTNLPINLTTKWPPERRERVALALGLGSTGIATAIAGSIFLWAGQRKLEQYKTTLLEGKQGTFTTNSFILADTGIILAGTSLGAFIGAAASAKTSYGAAKIETAIGVSVLAIGSAIYGIQNKYAKNTIRTSDDALIAESIPSTILSKDIGIRIASGVIGIGTGLLVTALSSLVSKKNSIAHRRRATASPNINAQTIALHIRFSF